MLPFCSELGYFADPFPTLQGFSHFDRLTPGLNAILISGAVAAVDACQARSSIIDIVFEIEPFQVFVREHVEQKNEEAFLCLTSRLRRPTTMAR